MRDGGGNGEEAGENNGPGNERGIQVSQSCNTIATEAVRLLSQVCQSRNGSHWGVCTRLRSVPGINRPITKGVLQVRSN